MLVLLLFIVAVIFLYAELFLPGIVLGVIGLAAFVASIVLAFKQYPDMALWITIGELVTASALIAIGLKRFPHSRMGKILILGRSLEKKLGYSGTDYLEKFVGMEGETITHLRPAGKAMVGSERLDVVTEGTFIDKGNRVKVVAVEGNRVVVREAEGKI